MSGQKQMLHILIGLSVLMCAQICSASPSRSTEAQIKDSQQGPISVERFEGSQHWKVYAPGQLKLDNEQLHNIRVVYGAKLGPYDAKVSLDVRDTFAHGRKADWIQWSFTREVQGEDGYPNLDLMVVDSETGELRFRMFPSGPTLQNGGAYSFIHANPNMVSEMTVGTDGKTSPEMHELNGVPVFDVAALGFILPFIDPSEETGFRLRTYNYSTVENVAVIFRDTQDPTIREADVLFAGGKHMITYRVSKQAPYFYGWDYRNVADGKSMFKMEYRGFVETSVGTENETFQHNQ